jgi:uncharacterized protein
MTAENEGRELSVTIAPDGLSATLSIRAGVSPEAVSEATVLDLLRARGVEPDDESRGLVSEAVGRFGDTPGQAFEAVIARGTPPRDGEDGRFEPEPSLAGRSAPPPTDADVAVDHYSASAFVIVPEGAVLGRLVPPTPHTDGRTVTGKPIPATPGRPFDVGDSDSVSVEPDGRVVARRTGILQMRPRLRIRDELVIDEAVDFSTGNIDFPGNVRIKGGVRDRFVVRSGGSLAVQGLVEAATVHARTDARLLRGVAGRGKGRVRVGRNLHALYLDSAVVRVGRDMVVDNEMIECDAAVGRRCESPDCAVLGGTLIVGRECSLGQIGSEGGVATHIVLGRLPDLDRLAADAVELLPQMDRESAQAIAQIRKIQARGLRMTPEEMQELTELQEAVTRCRGRVKPVKGSLQRALELAGRHTRVSLTVRRMIYHGATVWLPGGSERGGPIRADFREDIRGPVQIGLDAQGRAQVTDQLRESRTPLATVARISSDQQYLDWQRVREMLDAADARAA